MNSMNALLYTPITLAGIKAALTRLLVKLRIRKEPVTGPVAQLVNGALVITLDPAEAQSLYRLLNTSARALYNDEYYTAKDERFSSRLWGALRTLGFYSDRASISN